MELMDLPATLGRVGVWSGQLRSAPSADPGNAQTRAAVGRTAAYLEGLGYPTLWVPGGAGGPLFDDLDAALASTRRVTVASGVLNIWMHTATETATWFSQTELTHPGRVLLGLGVSHASLVERTGQVYAKPLSAMRDYLDALDRTAHPIPKDRLVLAALGPKMTQLSAERSTGAHPYHVTTPHIRVMRELLGPGPLLATELPVILDTNPDTARATARRHLRTYMSMPNYTNNYRLYGFDTDDFEDGGSDRLIDALVAWGSSEQIHGRVQAMLDAGADHVCIQALTSPGRATREETWRTLAHALLPATLRTNSSTEVDDRKGKRCPLTP